MKTKFNRYIALALTVVLSASCSDSFLEEKKNYGSYDDTFYQSQERTQAYVDNQYFDFFSAYKSPLQSVVGSYTDTYSRLTEELGGTQDYINPNKTLINAADASAYFGAKIGTGITNSPYNRIRECNNLLEDIDVKGATLDKTFRDQAKGQMYYLRALQYFDLMRIYGGVPIVTTVQTAAADNPEIQLPRAKVSEVVDQIVKDFDMAASLLPGNWSSANYGRATKGAALAQKARVLLTYASPLFNKGWDGSTERWNAALQAGLAAEAQLTADGYGLVGSNAKQWEQMFLTDNAFSPEAIVVQFAKPDNNAQTSNNSWERSIRLQGQGGVGGGTPAPKEMIDLFPLADGRRPTAANGYNDFTFFVNRDPRFYRTFAFSGVRWAYRENTTAVLWTYRWLDTANKVGFADGNSSASSPAFVRKMTNLTASNSSNYQYSGTDIFEYRYAELLLNIAECYAALGQTGNTVAYLGRIRSRVGIPSANNYGIGTLTDKYAAIEAVLYERRVELAYEGKRFWDVQRWMLYDNETLPGVTGGTVSKLGLAPINGTQRTGNFLQFKNPAAITTDPLAATRAAAAADPDAANFTAQLATLATFYNNNFVRTPLVTPMDNFNGVAVKIKFNPNYYVSGLNNTALTQNTWLLQTIG